MNHVLKVCLTLTAKYDIKDILGTDLDGLLSNYKVANESTFEIFQITLSSKPSEELICKFKKVVEENPAIQEILRRANVMNISAEIDIVEL